MKVDAESIFLSTLTYCIAVWGGAGKGCIENLQVLQNQAARIILRQTYRANRRTMFNRLSWLTVNQLINYHRILSVYKVRRHKEPEYLYSFLSRDKIGLLLCHSHIELCYGWGWAELGLRFTGTLVWFKVKVELGPRLKWGWSWVEVEHDLWLQLSWD